MATLMILRHAKSDWNTEYGTDRERPLNRRGIRSAKAVGRFVADYRIAPDLLLTSPAVRTVDTARIAASSGGWETRIRESAGLYGAHPNFVLNLIRQVEKVDRVMVVGHEPTMSGFLEGMTGNNLRVTTASLAYISIPIRRWADLEWRTGQLELFVRPRLLIRRPR